MDYNKRYIIGTPAKLQELFPAYNGNDVRKSIDESLAIYEVNLTDDELAALKRKTSIKIYSLEEIQVELNSPKAEGVWYAKEVAAQDQSPAASVNESDLDA